MFTDFKPARTLTAVRDEIAQQQAHVDFLESEMRGRAVIVADMAADGRHDELAVADYVAARERWEVAAAEMADARTQALTDNAITFLRSVDPSRLTLITGGAE